MKPKRLLEGKSHFPKTEEPPGIAVRFLQWFCPKELLEGIEGDLMESFARDLEISGHRSARMRFVINVLRFFRPGILFRNKVKVRLLGGAMLKNYFTVSYRQLVRNRSFAAINISGLALGIAAALLIYEYVSFEKDFDSIHKNGDHIYRVTTEWNRDHVAGDHRATTVPWAGPALKEAFPEVLEYARFASIDVFTGDNVVTYKEAQIREQGIFLADPGFLTMFSFQLLKGDVKTALNEPTDIIITESIARKYFQLDDPIGKTMSIDTHGNLSEKHFTVSGVIQDPPLNSHIAFDFLISFKVLWKGFDSGSVFWHWDYTFSYLLLHPSTDIHSLEKKISALRLMQHGKEMEHFRDKVDFRLQPLKDIHLYSALKGEAVINGDGRSLTFLVIVGICITLSAYINYINLATLRAIERRREIGVRKVVGSTKTQLTIQLLVESFVINMLSLLLAFLIYRLSIPLIESVFNIAWPSGPDTFLSGKFLLFIGLVMSLGIILSALYPAFILSSLKPAAVLNGKGQVMGGYVGFNLRKSLIVLQFVVCTVFCIGTFVLYRQLRFMKEHDLGMDVDQVLVVKGYGFQPVQVYENFRNLASRESVVHSVGFSSAAPGEEIIALSLKPKVSLAGRSSEPKEVKMIAVDENYLRTLKIRFISGRGFDRSVLTDSKSVIINEAAARLLGFNEPRDALNESLVGLDKDPLPVIGVIRNYHQRSLKVGYEPIVFLPAWTNDFGWNKRFLFVRLNPAFTFDERRHQITQVETIWKKVSPDKPFQYFFLDSHFDRQYKADSTFTSLFIFFSVSAILIACLGVFGLVAYTMLKRTKEIGVRKVLGASVQSIMILISGDFARLIIIASLIAVPLILLVLRDWLDQYAFRIDIHYGLFLIPLAFIFVLAMTTVLCKSLKVASSNPVDSLRHE